MATPRKNQISLADTLYYHCISRCVRRAFLCGIDALTGRSYEHRRDWVESKLLQLAQIFCIDVCAYAVMSNHTHVVLHVDKREALHLTDKAIVQRWHKLFKGTVLCQRFLQGEQFDTAELSALHSRILIYRERLSDISWFMRVLNEGIARQANREDDCTGRFWEGRFKSQALLDEAALVACLAYVDLNPIRAKAADLPEKSDYTSVKTRIASAKKGQQPTALMPFVGNPREKMPKGLPFELQSYLELVEWTGRCMREGKPGHISSDAAPILERLDICSENWLALTTSFTKVFHGAVGKEQALTTYCQHQHRKRRVDLGNSQALFA
ncbi:transposase [Pseudoalteromonas sp. YIC-827]|uniref:Transposase n=1 Tax=Pseudoalteromonas qingdaonensis TaxID=3131913 RepID=A0ABU9MZY4_9GAMM